MSKLPQSNQFIDLSDYGRPFARVIAQSLKNTTFTPIHVTIAFIISGLIGIVCIVQEYYWAAAFFLILKSILDAADGELARIKKTPSYTGRYLDSVADIILNFILLITIWFVTDGKLIYTALAFIGLQLQGTLYNYYYVILRNKYNGDTTSRVFEDVTPLALAGEKQRSVDILFILYKTCYGIFDKVIFKMDQNAVTSKKLPNWLMTAVSMFGLGFQLLMISAMFILNLKHVIIPFFIAFSGLIFIFIGIRRYINR